MSVKIGIFGQVHDDKYGVNSAYLNLITELGGIPIIIFPTTIQDFWATYNIEALLVPGGADVNPISYREIPSIQTGYQNPILEYYDKVILPEVLKTSIPIMGICRGLQILNVLHGGTLLQHLDGHPYSTMRTQLAHKVNTGKSVFKVNSLHHQGIDLIGKDLQIEATSEDDGIIEAISHKTKKVFAVQWHPEEIFDSFSIANFKRILR